MRDMMQRVPNAGESSFWYNLCLAGIGLSAALYLMGRKDLSLFVGLWPPTFAALGNRAEINKEIVSLVTGQPIQRIGGGEVLPRMAQPLGGGREGVAQARTA